MPWRRVVRSREVWAVTLSYFCYGYVAWIFFSWFYRYLAKVRGLDLKASAFYTMLPFLAMLVCCLLGGTTQRPAHQVARTAARPLRTRSICNGGRRHFHRLRLAGSERPAGQRRARRRRRCAVFLPEFFLVGHRRHRRRSSGSVSGFMNMGGQIGGAVTGSLTPWIAARYGWTTSFLVAAALCLLGALSWLAVNPLNTLTAGRANTR